MCLDVLLELLISSTGYFDGLLDAALRRSGWRGGDSLDAHAEDGLREHGRGGRAVTGNVGSLGSDFANHLRAHVFEGIAEFDFLGYGPPSLVMIGARILFDHRIAALGPRVIFTAVGEHSRRAKSPGGILTCYNLLRILFVPPDIFFATGNSDENNTV